MIHNAALDIEQYDITSPPTVEPTQEPTVIMTNSPSESPIHAGSAVPTKPPTYNHYYVWLWIRYTLPNIENITDYIGTLRNVSRLVLISTAINITRQISNVSCYYGWYDNIYNITRISFIYYIEIYVCDEANARAVWIAFNSSARVKLHLVEKMNEETPLSVSASNIQLQTDEVSPIKSTETIITSLAENIGMDDDKSLNAFKVLVLVIVVLILIIIVASMYHWNQRMKMNANSPNSRDLQMDLLEEKMNDKTVESDDSMDEIYEAPPGTMSITTPVSERTTMTYESQPGSNLDLKNNNNNISASEGVYAQTNDDKMTNDGEVNIHDTFCSPIIPNLDVKEPGRKPSMNADGLRKQQSNDSDSIYDEPDDNGDIGGITDNGSIGTQGNILVNECEENVIGHDNPESR